jgi:predicted ATPase
MRKASLELGLQLGRQEKQNVMDRIIITGGPGSGKSTLINQLSLRGYHCVPEVSRVLIQEQVATESDCLPWRNLNCFAHLALDRMILDYNCNLQAGETAFFDRGIPDIIAYLKVGAIPLDIRFDLAARQHRYHTIVFVAPPWREIYVNDEERWQTFDESTLLYDEIVSTYKHLGYKMKELPMTSVASRCDFIISVIQSPLNS